MASRSVGKGALMLSGVNLVITLASHQPEIRAPAGQACRLVSRPPEAREATRAAPAGAWHPRSGACSSSRKNGSRSSCRADTTPGCISSHPLSDEGALERMKCARIVASSRGQRSSGAPAASRPSPRGWGLQRPGALPETPELFPGHRLKGDMPGHDQARGHALGMNPAQVATARQPLQNGPISPGLLYERMLQNPGGIVVGLALESRESSRAQGSSRRSGPSARCTVTDPSSSSARARIMF